MQLYLLFLSPYHVLLASRLSSQGSHIELALVYWSSFQVCNLQKVNNVRKYPKTAPQALKHSLFTSSTSYNHKLSKQLRMASLLRELQLLPKSSYKRLKTVLLGHARVGSNSGVDPSNRCYINPQVYE